MIIRYHVSAAIEMEKTLKREWDIWYSEWELAMAMYVRRQIEIEKQKEEEDDAKRTDC